VPKFDKKENMNLTISAAIYFYFVFIGACYLLGFWTPLHFNILELVSPADIIRSATYPIIPAAISTLFLVATTSYNSQGFEKPSEDDPKSAKVAYWGVMILLSIVAVYVISKVIISLYYLYLSEPSRRLSFALPIASILSAIYFVSNPPFMKQQKTLQRNFILILMCSLPATAYFQGQKNINNILEGKASYYKLKNETENCKSTDSSDTIYLGIYGGRYLFINSESKDICIENHDSITLKFREHRKTSQQTPVDK
jgi:hypothetical protein